MNFPIDGYLVVDFSSEEFLFQGINISTNPSNNITKTCLYNLGPLKPHFYKVKLRFTGVNIIFLISDKKHRLWVFVRTALARRF